MELIVFALFFWLFILWGKSGSKVKQSTQKAPARPAQDFRPEPVIHIEHLHLWEETGNARIHFEVVGESNYQHNISPLEDRDDLIAVLVPEKNNPYDKNAVRVEIDRKTVGYLSRDDAVSFRGKLKRKSMTGQATKCKAYITGGHMKNGQKMSYGVELDFT